MNLPSMLRRASRLSLFAPWKRAGASSPSTSARRSPPSTQPRPVAFAVSLVVLLSVWQLLVTVTRTPPWLLPAPTTIARRFNDALIDGTLPRHVWPTVVESVGGFVLALLLAAPMGYLLAHRRGLERWLSPYLAAIQSVPVIAVAPLLLVWWSGSELTRNIIVAAIVIFFPIFSATLTGIRTIPRELREVATVEGASLPQRIRYLELPLALPVLFSGIRTSLAYATTGAVVAEFLGSRYGLGAMINLARGLIDTPLIFVGLTCLILITLGFYGLVVLCERYLLAWQDVR